MPDEAGVEATGSSCETGRGAGRPDRPPGPDPTPVPRPGTAGALISTRAPSCSPHAHPLPSPQDPSDRGVLRRLGRQRGDPGCNEARSVILGARNGWSEWRNRPAILPVNDRACPAMYPAVRPSSADDPHPHGSAQISAQISPALTRIRTRTNVRPPFSRGIARAVARPRFAGSARASPRGARGRPRVQPWSPATAAAPPGVHATPPTASPPRQTVGPGVPPGGRTSRRGGCRGDRVQRSSNSSVEV